MVKSYDNIITLGAGDGIKLEGLQWGELVSSNKVFLCLHGLSSHALWFEKLAVKLKGCGCCVVAVNRRGSGGSGGDRMYAESLAILLDDLGLWVDHLAMTGEVSLIAHCWGAMVAQYWMEQNKNRGSFRGSVLLVPPYRTVFDKKWHLWVFPLLARYVGKMKIRLPYGAEIFSENEKVVQSIERDDLYQRFCTPALLDINLQLRKLINHGDFEGVLIFGAEDKLLGSVREESFGNVVAFHAGHGLILEKAEELAELIMSKVTTGYKCR